MFSHTCKTAVKAVIFLATRFETGEKAGIKDIAEHIEASEHTVGKMLQTLVKQNVIDPEIGLNIVDLGLIYQIDFNESDNEIYVAMTLTTQFCPMGESIKDGAMNAMQQAFPTYKINIELVFDPPWNADRISEEGQQYLNS